MIKPFLAEVTTRATAKPLGSALPAVDSEPAISPWTPRGGAPTEASTSAPAIDVAGIREEARRAGQAEGLRETEALRARLTQLIGARAAAHDAIAAPTAELIAEAAACVVGTWAEGADHKALFAPVVRGWLARSASEPATARVHPSDVAIVTELAGDSRLGVIGDASIAPGDIRIRGAALELTCAWSERLGELRRMIAEALAGGAA